MSRDSQKPPLNPESEKEQKGPAPRKDEDRAHGPGTGPSRPQEGHSQNREKDPAREAWIANFYTENHLAYEAFPREVASPEQLRFMVYTEPGQLYYPCSDRTFNAIINKTDSDWLIMNYVKVWDKVKPLVTSVIEDRFKREFLLNLLHIKFRHDTASLVMLPSRIEKRLLHIFIRVSEIDRPLSRKKEARNRKVHELLSSRAYKEALNDRQGLDLETDSPLDEIDLRINFLKLKRLFSLAFNLDKVLETEDLTTERLKRFMGTEVSGPGWEHLEEILRQWHKDHEWHYLLWKSPLAGSILIDLEVIKILVRFSVKVIISVKHAFYFDEISMADIMEDPFLTDHFKIAEVITERNISKNSLLDKLKSDKTIFVIDDGTQERFNPLLTSVTFARAFKEADEVIIRSPNDAWCISRSSFQYTRNMMLRDLDVSDRLVINFRPKHPKAVRFSEADLRAKAEALIYHLKMQKRKGKTIMFYSAIVGSIPGQLEMAKKILKVFVNYLRQKHKDVVIINPAEHFEPGMDADDLMYMWEIVQRSGLIDIWRFQTVDDIEKAFELMGQKVPPEWVGKDATYSTGCTKEMQIAREVQKEHPEMQIIGPSWEKFLRRKEYGVGKLYDRTLGDA
jgi:hypothetical protein